MNIVEKVTSTRKTIKEVFEDEWDTSSIADLSTVEVEKMYTLPSSKITSLTPFGVATGCNFTLKHKKIPSHKLHIIYYNFPEIGRLNSKVTKSACDKLNRLYQDGIVNKEDSLMVIINDTISESLEESFYNLNVNLQNSFENMELDSKIIEEMQENSYPLEKKHFRNIHIFDINSLTNNLLQHRLIPKHRPIRKKDEIEEILQKCNCSLNQLPVIQKNDIVSKLTRLAPGDLCEIIRKSVKCGEYPFYRICK